MNFFNNISLRSKLTVISMVSCTIALLIAGFSFIAYDYQQTKVNMVREYEIMADVIGANCTAAIAFDNAEDATEILASLEVEENITSACVHLADNTVFAKYPQTHDHKVLHISRVTDKNSHYAPKHLELVRDIILGGEKIGNIYLEISLKPLYSRLQKISLAASLVILISLVIVLLVISRLQRLISQPILNLATTAKQISDSRDYSVRVLKTSQDEIGTLVEQFNSMLSHIQTRDSALMDARNELEQRVKERTVELEMEVIEHSRAKKIIEISLREKETLLKEVHHRVKNNLQIITSLLNLQSNQVSDINTQELFKDSMSRVKSMALIHEQLYQSKDLAEINFSEYVGCLTSYLLSTISGNFDRISIKNEIDDTILTVDMAVPCGLIINELVTNSIKYAFKNNEGGEIIINFHRLDNEKVRLSVSDNGGGIPESVDIKNTNSLGMQLVHSLTDQLDGELYCDVNNGTCFTIEFECENQKKDRKQHVVV